MYSNKSTAAGAIVQVDIIMAGGIVHAGGRATFIHVSFTQDSSVAIVTQAGVTIDCILTRAVQAGRRCTFINVWKQI